MKRRRLDASLLILAGLTLVVVALAFGKDASLPLKGLQSSARLFGSVWIELALGFILAGMIDVLVPAASISRWLGAGKLHQGVLAGTAAGLVMPGGPYLFFPLAAKLFADGASPWRAHRVPLREDAGEPGPHPDLRGAADGLADYARALHSFGADGTGAGLSRAVALRPAESEVRSRSLLLFFRYRYLRR